MDDIILNFTNGLLLNNEKQQWSISNIIPLPKKGDLSKASNYRGISLSSITLKLINRMILINRIQPVLEPHLRHNQHGFRPSRSTTSQILALRRLIEGVKHKRFPATITFVDFKKALSTVFTAERCCKY